MPYQGHKNWVHWNVSLWINNDEGLYNLCRDIIKHTHNKDIAALGILEHLNESGITETPDGAKYTKTNIRAALVGM